MNAPLIEKPEVVEVGPEPQTLPEAICSVMSNMQTLTKSETNKHGGYDFVSIDAFLVAMNPLCAEAGLYILQNEIEAEIIPNEKRDKASHLRAAFDFTICHRSGETAPPVRRTVMVPAIGPQAFGIAQSYALKQFMRSTFMVATGDADDADTIEAQNLPKRKSSAQAKKDGDNERIKNLIDNSTDVAQLDAIWVGIQKELETLPRAWFEPYADRVEQHRASLVVASQGGEAGLPGDDDTTPEAPLDPQEWLAEYRERLTECADATAVTELNEEVSPVLEQYPATIQEQAAQLSLEVVKGLTSETE